MESNDRGSTGRDDHGRDQRQGQSRDSIEGAFDAQERSERLIADRLDALEAEKVLHRALELEADAIDQPHMFSPEQLESIAEEIDLDLKFVRQALGEVRLTPEERTRVDRWILPDHIMAVETIKGLERPDLDALIDDWMAGYEGLIAADTIADGKGWDVDRRMSARMRAMRTGGGNRISRVSGGDVAHRVHSISGAEHVVAMQSRGEGPLLLAKAAIAIAAVVFALGAIGTISTSTGIVDLLTRLAALGVISAGIIGIGVSGARRWAKGMGRALRRSLTGLASRIGGRRRRRSGQGKVGDLAPAAVELIEALTDRIQGQRPKNHNPKNHNPKRRHRRDDA